MGAEQSGLFERIVWGNGLYRRRIRRPQTYLRRLRSGVLHHHLHQEILSQLLVRQSGQQSAAAGIPPNAPSGFGLPVLRWKIHAQTCRCPLLQQLLPTKSLSKTCYRCCKYSKWARRFSYRLKVCWKSGAATRHLILPVTESVGHFGQLKKPDELSIQGSLPGARVQRGAGRQRRPQKAAGILKHRPSRQARPAHILLGIICIIWRKMAVDPAALLLRSPTPSCWNGD